jgi:hypothetical protein
VQGGKGMTTTTTAGLMSPRMRSRGKFLKLRRTLATKWCLPRAGASSLSEHTIARKGLLVLTQGEARRIAINIAKLPVILSK